MFESSTEESHTSRYLFNIKVNLALKQVDYFGEIYSKFKERYDLLGKNLATKLLIVRFASLFELLMNVKPHEY